MSTQKQIEIAEYLNGTCKDTGDAAEAFGVDGVEVLEAVIAEEIECCTACGWWAEADDMEEVDGELECSSCRHIGANPFDPCS